MSVTAAQSRAVTNGHALAIQPGMTVLFVFLYETEKHRQPLPSKVYGVFGINLCSASVLLGIVFFFVHITQASSQLRTFGRKLDLLRWWTSTSTTGGT